MDATHVTIATAERTVLCSTPDALLEATRIAARVGGPDVLLSCVVDEHVHAVVSLDRARAGPWARRLARALGTRVPVELAPARFKRVEGRSHLRWLVDYVLQQPQKHGLQNAGSAALWPGSCFVDLVGARILDGFDPRGLAGALPRLRRDDLYAAVGLEPVEPLDDEALRAEGPRRIGDAAAAAVGLPRLEGSSRPVVRARRAAGRLCRALGFPDTQIAFGLRCPEGTASRLTRLAPPDPLLDRAIRLQLALRRVAEGWADTPFPASLSPAPNHRARK